MSRHASYVHAGRTFVLNGPSASTSVVRSISARGFRVVAEASCRASQSGHRVCVLGIPLSLLLWWAAQGSSHAAPRIIPSGERAWTWGKPDPRAKGMQADSSPGVLDRAAAAEGQAALRSVARERAGRVRMVASVRVRAAGRLARAAVRVRAAGPLARAAVRVRAAGAQFWEGRAAEGRATAVTVARLRVRPRRLGRRFGASMGSQWPARAVTPSQAALRPHTRGSKERATSTERGQRSSRWAIRPWRSSAAACRPSKGPSPPRRNVL